MIASCGNQGLCCKPLQMHCSTSPVTPRLIEESMLIATTKRKLESKCYLAGWSPLTPSHRSSCSGCGRFVYTDIVDDEDCDDDDTDYDRHPCHPCHPCHPRMLTTTKKKVRCRMAMDMLVTRCRVTPRVLATKCQSAGYDGHPDSHPLPAVTLCRSKNQC